MFNNFQQDFNEGYFRSVYSDYLTLERQQRYARRASYIDELLEQLLGISTNTLGEKRTILDFGCAVGWHVDALKNLGYRTSGFDPSSWAVEFGSKTLGIKGLTSNFNEVSSTQWDVVLFLDTLEHIPVELIPDIFRSLSAPWVVVKVPTAQSNGGLYIEEHNERDETHVVRFTEESWKILLASLGYNLIKIVPRHPSLSEGDNFYTDAGRFVGIFQRSTSLRASRLFVV